MSSRDERFLRIVINLVNTALDHGLIDQNDPWFPNATEPFIRFSTTLDGDIPAVVDVSGWHDGVCSLRWALWPRLPEVSLDISPFSNRWSGEVWGTAYVERHHGLVLWNTGRFHCRESRWKRVSRIVREGPRDGLLVVGLAKVLADAREVWCSSNTPCP